MFLSITFQGTDRPLHGLRTRQKNGWFIVEDPEKRLQVKLRVRRAYPGTYCQTLHDGSVALGYGPLKPQGDNEFLQVRLTPRGDITIQRDVVCTLPLFYGQTHNRFVAGNEYHAVCEALAPLTVNRSAASRMLLDPIPWEPYTMWQEMGILGDRQTLRLQNGVLSVQQPPPRSWTYSSELPRSNAHEFPARLSTHLNRFIETRLQGNVLGFELSGGLDSAFLPLYLAQRGHSLEQSQAGTVLQPDVRDQERQQQKITMIEAVTGLRSKRIYPKPETHYPLSHMFATGKFYPIHAVHELYEPGMAEIADHFKSSGVEVVITGGGGDQLFEHRPHPSIFDHQRFYEDQPHFVTSTAKSLFSIRDPFEPIPTLLTPGVVSENLAHANIYIERGMWPVSPFHNVELFNYCQGLPVQFRSDKNIFRAYFEASHFPPMLYRGENEDFGNFFEACWNLGVYAPLVNQFIEHSSLHELGLVDVTKIQRALQAKTVDELFAIYVWLVLELNTKLVSNSN